MPAASPPWPEPDKDAILEWVERMNGDNEWPAPARDGGHQDIVSVSQIRSQSHDQSNKIDPRFLRQILHQKLAIRHLGHCLAEFKIRLIFICPNSPNKLWHSLASVFVSFCGEREEEKTKPISNFINMVQTNLLSKSLEFWGCNYNYTILSSIAIYNFSE